MPYRPEVLRCLECGAWVAKINQHGRVVERRPGTWVGSRYLHRKKVVPDPQSPTGRRVIYEDPFMSRSARRAIFGPQRTYLVYGACRCGALWDWRIEHTRPRLTIKQLRRG
jgi:hypothetical protein